ncbi:MAG: efflux RND transporter permease subunit [Lachnospiraceae bacterium]|nr:efflux RND transporter permease subunit [Lachnospiraceae bacterium]
MLTKLAIKRPVSVILIILSLVVFGITSIFGFQLQLIPDMEMPMLIVYAAYPGADAQSVDELVTSVIEDAGDIVSGIDMTESMSRENVGLVLFTFDYGTDMDEAHNDLRAALETASLALPDNVDTPTIIEMNINAVDVIDISAIEVGDIDLEKTIKEDIVPQLETLPGSAQVSVYGDAAKYIRVLLDSSAMNQYGLSMSQVSQYMSACDFSYPAGSVSQGKQDVDVATVMEYNTAQRLKELPITTSKGQTIQLQDIATVSEAVEEATSISRHDGRENLSIGVQAKTSYGTVNVCRDVKNKLEQIKSENPDIEFEITYDSSESILGSLKAVAEALILGVLFSMLVLFLFFGDFKASLIVGASMPVSLLATLILMNAMGFSMNLVTLTSLVIAIGMMVDSSIVVIESCFRKKDQKLEVKEAALKGAKEVAASIIASTITTIVVYLPLATMKSLSGQMFSALGWTIVFAMLASLISAIMLIPLFYSIFKPVPKENLPIDRLLDKVKNGYAKLLPKLLYKKKTVLLVFVALLIGSFAIATTLNVEMIPAADEGMVEVSMNFRPGTTLEEKDKALKEWEKIASEDPDVESYNVSGGSSGISIMNAGGGDGASLTATLKDDRKRKTSQVADDWNEIAATMTNVDCMASSSGASITSFMSSDSYEVYLEGFNLDELKTQAADVTEELRGLPGVVKASNSLAVASTMVKIDVDPLKAMQVGLTPITVGMAVKDVIGGVKANTITRDGSEYEVRLEYPKGEYDDLNNILNMNVSSPMGKLVPLRDIATLEYTDSPDTITKMNDRYIVTLTINASADELQQVKKDVDAYLADRMFEGSVSVFDSTNVEMQTTEITNILKAILTAIFLVFLVMAMQFESPRFSLMVMTTIPFALIGSFFLLRVTNSSISMISMMGFLMLMGIVVNNGILYVDTANMLKADMPVEEALVESGCIRLRPILMTTLTTILSMVPMSLGLGKNGVIMQGMALVIIGGLIASTILSLILIPSFYLMLDKDYNKDRKAQKKLKKAEKKAEKKELKQKEEKK